MRVGKIKAKNSKANFVIFFLLDYLGFILQQLDQFWEVNPLFGLRMYPELFTSVTGQ